MYNEIKVKANGEIRHREIYLRLEWNESENSELVSYGNANFEQQSFHLYINYTLYLAYLSSNKSHNTAAFLSSVSALIELKMLFSPSL